MVARYVAIDREVFEAAMSKSGFAPVQIAGTSELVFERPVKRYTDSEFAVRVYSSIPAHSGVGRGCGEDAIRVVLIHTPTGKGVWSATRTHRTQGWRERMLERMREAWRAASAITRCPSCGTRPMLRRVAKGTGREFLGCVGYPTCKGTMNVQQ